MKLASEGICLTVEEFWVLAAVFGIQKLYCFAETEKKDAPADQEAYDRAVFNLVRQGLLQTVTGGLQISPDVEKIFRILQQAVRFVLVESKVPREEQYCLYFEQNRMDRCFVVAEPGIRKNEYIRLTLYKDAEFRKWLSERSAWPEEMETDGLWKAEEAVGEDLSCFFLYGEMSAEEKFLELEGMELTLTVIGIENGEITGRIGLMHQILEERIIYQKKYRKEIFSFTSAEVMRLLIELMEDDYDIG